MTASKIHHQTSTHMMKTTDIGRPFVKDIHELFATLIVSLNLDTRRYLFKQYPNSFTTDDAVLNLGSLKFSQSNRIPDPNDPSRIITTTTTTTFSMTRDMAKSVCQYFMDARLFENAVDSNSRLFKEKGIYILTPKGLHILERFITHNGITADHLVKVFTTQPICMKLLNLERNPEDDSIIINRSIIEIIFRRFAGKIPNDNNHNNTYRDSSEIGRPTLEHLRDTSAGIRVKDRQHVGITWKHTFHGLGAIEWLYDHTTIVCREEAMEIGSYFFQANLIEQVTDKLDQNNLREPITFKYSKSALYHLTPEGRRIAGWEGPISSIANISDEQKSNKSSSGSVINTIGANGLTGNFDNNSTEEDLVSNVKESNSAKLRQILEEPALRSLFKEFLRSNFCEENLSFWMDVQDLKRRFNISSSAFGSSRQPLDHHSAMEKHQKDLITLAFQIYNTYLAPSSASELNIEHSLRHDMNVYMSDLLTGNGNSKSQDEKSTVESFDQIAAGQLQLIVQLFERIQDHIFRLMATDSVPKFIRTERFQTLMRSMEDYSTDLAQEFDKVKISSSSHHDFVKAAS